MSREFVPAELDALLENVRSEVAPTSFGTMRDQIESEMTNASEKVTQGQSAELSSFLSAEVTAEVASEVQSEVQSEATAATAAEVTAEVTTAAR